MITPRKEERAAIAELLDAEFDSADALANAVIKKAFELFQVRRLYVVAAGNLEGPRALVGPFATMADAKRAGDNGGYLLATPLTLWPIEFLEPIQDPDPLPACVCKHTKGEHDHQKGRGWCWATGGSTKTGNACGCKAYNPEGNA